MSDTTSNYGLYITDDSSEKFFDWRTKMNGTENSNMVKIDNALSEKANNSVIVSTTLLASAWTGVDSPFIQELAVEGLGETQNGIISVSHDATIVQRDAARNALLSVIGQTNGMLNISADGEMPEVDIPVIVILLG